MSDQPVSQSNQPVVDSKTLTPQTTDTKVIDSTKQTQPTEQSVGESARTDISNAMKDAIRKYKVKVDGAELEVSEDELVSNYQLKRASDMKFQEAAKLRKQLESVVGLLKTNPRKALEDPAIGVDVRKLAEDVLSEHMEAELLTPEQRELKQLKAQLAAREAADLEAKQKAEAEQAIKLEEQYTNQYQRDIETALKGAGLPITNLTMRTMANYMANSLDAGYDLAANDVVDLVKEDYTKQLKEFFSAADATAMASLLGEDNMTKLRTYDLARVKDPSRGVAGGSGSSLAAATDGTTETTKSSPKKSAVKKSLNQLLAEVRAEAGLKD